MYYLLVIIVAGTPMQTNWQFSTLDACLRFEETVAREYKRVYEEALERIEKIPHRDPEAARALASSRLHRGTCIPTDHLAKRP